MKRLALAAFLSTLVLAATGCKGDPSTPQYWEKELNGAHRAKDKVRVLDDLRESAKATPAFRSMLEEHLKSEKFPEVKGAIARVLGDLKDPASVEALTDAVAFGNAESAENAMNKEICTALARIGDPKSVPTLMRLLKAHDPYVRIEAIQALGALHAKQAVDPLMDIATDETGEPFISKKAVQALGEIGDSRAVPALVKMMFKERRGVSFYVESSFALFQIGKPAGDALVPLVKGEDKALWNWAKENNILEPAIYAKSAQVLGDLHDSRAEKALLQELAFNSDFLDLKLFVRMKAADALGRLRAKEAVKPLAAMLDEEEATARQEYIRALIHIGGREAIPALAKSASTGSWDAREPAIIGIAMLGDEREIPTLEKLGKEEEKLTEAECKDNPDYLGCKSPGELVKKHLAEIATHQKRLEAAKACKSDGACWAKKLDDADAGVRERAALEVGRSGNAELVAALIQHLHETNLDARSAVIQAADWLITEKPQAAKVAAGSLDAIEKQLADERSKTEFVKVNEDLKRLAVDLHRQSA